MDQGMRKKSLAKWILVASSLAALHFPAHAADAVVAQAKRLVDSKHPDQAYDLLAPLQSDRAGEPEYDYLLGISALDSGKAAEAVFAFERFLAVNPDNGPARLELARAYYEMGDIKASRQEFDAVKRQQVPEQASQAIQNYLSAIDKIASDATGTKVRGYIEGGIGHDTNANSATSTNQIAIPLFGGAIATLDSSSTKKSDNFAFGGAGVSVRHPFSPEWTLNANAGITQRAYNDVSQYDIGTIDSSVGLTRTVGVEQFTGAVQYQKLGLDHSSYRQTYGALGQWQHSIDDQRQFTVYGQAMRLDYASDQEIRTVDRYLTGAAYSQAFDTKLLPVVYGGGYIGTERPTASGVSQLKNDFIGARAGGQISFSAKLALIAGASVEHRDYRGEEPGFLKDRSDRQYDFSLALAYMPINDWIIRPEIAYTRNYSNIPLNDFSRTQYFVTVRRNFN
jgi:tetratricopeptide (TPR) repeat protein